MGVLNCTPDSFSDGKLILSVNQLISQAEAMINEGADIIDVGGESTRPNATPVSLDEELNRVLPVIRGLSEKGYKLSIDTMKAEVMGKAIDAGACLVNDVSALQFDKESMHIVASSGVDVCLMHMQGTPKTMQKKPNYANVIDEVLTFFEQRIEACLAAGIKSASIILDPGIGFGKRLEDNLELIANLDKIKQRFGLPVLLGTSRKSFLGVVTGAKVQEREIETAVSSAIGVFCGADMIRVHDCKAHQKTVLLASKLADFKLMNAQEAIAC